jgi:hypothetical protein
MEALKYLTSHQYFLDGFKHSVFSMAVLKARECARCADDVGNCDRVDVMAATRWHEEHQAVTQGHMRDEFSMASTASRSPVPSPATRMLA